VGSCRFKSRMMQQPVGSIKLQNCAGYPSRMRVTLPVTAELDRAEAAIPLRDVSRFLSVWKFQFVGIGERETAGTNHNRASLRMRFDITWTRAAAPNR
jgi:hypothetical protein